MIFNFNYIRAFIIMLKAHWHQRDKGENRYIYHPIRVSKSVEGLDAKIVALLHDVLEDSTYTIEKLSFLSKEQIEALKVLSNNKGVDYFEYIEKIRENELAKKVKLADLDDNLNLKRLKKVTKKDKERYRKYIKAKDLLMREKKNKYK